MLLAGNLSSFGQAKADSTKNQHDKKTQAALEELVNNIKGAKKNIVEDEIIGGIILDQTKTKIGKDFYDQFNQDFTPPDESIDYVIVIEEKPSFATTTIITLTINDIEIYSNYLQPKEDIMEALVGEAVNTATQFIVNYNQIIAEMSTKEQLGTGIF